MSSTIINLIIQLVAGAIGGQGAASTLKNFSLGLTGNMIAGAVGGLGLGQLLQAYMPALAGATASGIDVGSIVEQIVGGGVGGAILTLVVGFVRNLMSNHRAPSV